VDKVEVEALVDIEKLSPKVSDKEELVVVEPVVSVDLLFGGKTHDESTLEDNRCALENLIKTTDWRRAADIEVIAQRIDEVLSAFPELEFDYRRSDLAASVISDVTPPLRALKIARILAPEDESICEQYLIALSQAGDWDDLRNLLSNYKPGEDIDISIAKIVFEMGGNDPHGAAVALEDLSLRLSNTRSLGALRVAHARARFLLPREDDITKSTAFAANMVSLSKIVERFRRPINRVGKSGLVNEQPAIDSNRIRRLEAIIGSHLRKHHSKSIPCMHPKMITSDPTPWSIIVLERQGSLNIPAHRFSSDYAGRRNGIIYSRRHPATAPFIFGPYISLAEGFYAARFLGDGDEALEFELAVTFNAGQYRLASSRATLIPGANDGILGELKFNVAHQTDGFEFVIHVLGERGNLNFRGVLLIKLK